MQRIDTNPFQICRDDTVGRHLVATTPIEAGTVILKEPPLVRGPFLYTTPLCLGCGRILNQDNARPCNKCGWPLCSDVCEKSAKHQPECHLTEGKGSKMNIVNFGIQHPSYQFVTLLRCLYQKLFHQDIWEKMMVLESHAAFNPQLPPSLIMNFFKLNSLFTEEEIAKVLGILEVNGHELPLSQPHELVLYATSSMLEHSCKANCTKTFTNDGEIVIIAAENVKIGDHLSICYTDPLWGTANRRQHLHQTKQFWCQCPRCQDPTEFGTHANSMLCPNRNCDGFIYPKSFIEDVEDWHCSKCSETLSVESAQGVLQKIGQNLAEMSKGYPSLCKDFIKKFKRALAPNHYYMLDVKMALTQMLGSQNPADLTDNDLALLLKISDDLLVVIEKIAPAEKRLRGILLFQSAKAQMEISRRKNDQEDLLKTLARCKEILQESCRCLEHEPSRMQEGILYRKILLELKQMDDCQE